MNRNIYILSRPIQSGKTTLLQKWIATSSSVKGILTPDVAGARKLYDIAKDEYHELQVSTPTEHTLTVGKFHFYKDSFTLARNLLINALNEPSDWLVIDEIGRLEMDRQEGLEPAVSEIIRYYRTHPGNGKLLLVIRDYLLQQAIIHYQLPDPIILNDLK